MKIKTKNIIKYILIIIFILFLVFLSQKAYSWRIGKNIIFNASDKASASVSKGSNWITSKIYPKTSGVVQNRGDIIKNEIKQEKEKISENILEKIKNYFSGVGNSIINPGTPQNCSAPTTSSAK